MSPIMEPHARWYLRDVLRQTKYTSLFWVCRLFAKGDAVSIGEDLYFSNFYLICVEREADAFIAIRSRYLPTPLYYLGSM